MSTMCDIMDWESEISVKHKTKTFPNVKNGMNFCAKPDTHTITVRDYVILKYMGNPVHFANLEFETVDSWPLGNSLYVRVYLTNGMNNLWRIRHLYTFS